jgi:hypothetical protein
MYMKYILNYRVKVTEKVKVSRSSDPECAVRLDLSGLDKDEGKNNEILLQIRNLLKGLKSGDSWGKKAADKAEVITTLGVTRLELPRDRSSVADVSEQSSDQGIDVGDEVSTISDTSSHKDTAKDDNSSSESGHKGGNKSPNSSSRSSRRADDSPFSTLTRHHNQLSAEYGACNANNDLSFPTTPTSTLNRHHINGYPRLDTATVPTFPGKLNPAYVPEEVEETPKWLNDFLTESRNGASPLAMMDGTPTYSSGCMSYDTTGRSSPCDDLADDKRAAVFTISDGLPYDEHDFTSLQLHVPEVSSLWR